MWPYTSIRGQAAVSSVTKNYTDIIGGPWGVVLVTIMGLLRGSLILETIASIYRIQRILNFL